MTLKGGYVLGKANGGTEFVRACTCMVHGRRHWTPHEQHLRGHGARLSGN